MSVDYLTKPIEVFQEMHRCLKPGGVAIMSFSNRCFPTKGERKLHQTGQERGAVWSGNTAAAPAGLLRRRLCSQCWRLLLAVRCLLAPDLPPCMHACPPHVCAAISMWTSTGDLDHIWIVGEHGSRPAGCWLLAGVGLTG